MVTVQVRDIKSVPGFGGTRPQGTATVTLIIRSEEIGRLEIGVQVSSHRNEDLNIQEAHAVLQRFSQQFSEALMQPLAFE